ncbi:peptidoglycan DD-metalloendopeptidase family protein [Luteimonas sp. SJ-92]|uniref:Peptidoglycan DD-metalloendopeptidase family protein n=1 Tax=Luteimonas salinisoli TaxID=2752307 RepID=A0A853JAV9_9GAMM|nr:peptidoglycan DD-metalloendopeptidase family protein [Luteimonas salinisoli]NZA25770.1 peptidoglycan DD-metalloendopeptidase family protein [Luteimonas salinisoli]
MSSHRSAAQLLATCALLAGGHAAAIDPSQGVYRIPYADGTEVRVTNDHVRHAPPGRIDMRGRGGGTYRIVAAADGHVRHIEDGFDQRLTCKKGDGQPRNNNYVWIEHANGEWTKYTHMQKGSVTGRRKANLRVGQFVKAGTWLGDEGEVGCASGPHLHFEVGVPRASDPISSVGGFLQDNDDSERNRIPRICGISGGRFASDTSYTARRVPGNIAAGAREVARHGVPARDYQCLYDQAVAAGYTLEWIDGFDVGGAVHYNAVFRPAGNTVAAAFHGLTAGQYQQRFGEYTRRGYQPHQVESYGSRQGSRYAVIFRRQSGPAYSAYHGLSAEAHQQRMDALTADGYRPRNVSVVSSGGQRRYTALYERADIGSWQARSALTGAQYQEVFEANSKQGRQLVYLNAYVHDGQPHFSAIWSSRANGAYRARHGLTGAQYQSAWQDASGAGLLTRNVSGYGIGGSARYAAVWRR